MNRRTFLRSASAFFAALGGIAPKLLEQRQPSPLIVDSSGPTTVTAPLIGPPIEIWWNGRLIDRICNSESIVLRRPGVEKPVRVGTTTEIV